MAPRRPAGLRFIARRVKPARRHAKKPTEFEKATGIRTLPFHGCERNQAWLLAANLAADLTAYLQLLGLRPDDELATAEPESPRAMLLHIPARPTSHARTRVVKIEQSWPRAHTVVKAWERPGRIPAPA